MRRVVPLFLLLLSLPAPCLLGHYQSDQGLAQNPPYVREGSIGDTGKKPTPPNSGPFQYIPITAWAGHKFIFLPKPKALQRYGYQEIYGGKGKFGLSRLSGTGAAYAECVGRIATVAEVAADRDDPGIYHVKLEMDDDGHTYKATAYNGVVQGIGLVADIDAARSLWLGKTLWYEGDALLTYNAETDEYGTLKLKRYSAVKVVDIVAGWYEFEPLRLIVQTSEGSTGFEDIMLSGTNTSDSLRESGMSRKEFLTEDPRRVHAWSSEVWSAIEGRTIFVGMTAEQVRFSLGEPTKINTTVVQGAMHEQWVYRMGLKESQHTILVYLENGVVTAVQI